MGADRPVAVVTGASRGVGKGVALALGEAGWAVYVTGRSTTRATEAVGGTIGETAAQVAARGGEGIAVACDHTEDAQVEEVFARVGRERGRLDLLVNNVFQGPPGELGGAPFWERPLGDWDLLIDLSLRAHFVASSYAARLMVSRGSGLIANISSFGARSDIFSVLYCMSKAGLDRMAQGMAKQLAPHGVHAVSLWLGPVRTEKVMALGVEDLAGFKLSEAESPEFVGRILARLVDDPGLAALSGGTYIAAELAEQFGVTDVDGATPRSLRAALGAPA